MDEPNNDVTPIVEPETTTTTPGGDQTTPVVPEGESTTPTETNEENKPIPYSRFKEVNDKLRQQEEKFAEYEKRLSEMGRAPAKPADPQEEQVKGVLKQYGFMTKEEVQAELRRTKEDQAVQTELTRLEGKYDGKNGLPKFDRKKVIEFALDRQIADPEIAYKSLFEKEYLNWHITQASAKSKGIKSESSDGSGGKPLGADNKDLYSAAQAGDSGAFDALMKRSNVFKKMFNK